jgi:predicted dithiol-disulfide oxidoreductase (DUF899 family)
MPKNRALPRIVSQAQWQVACDNLLAKEKAETRARDALAVARRQLSMYRIDKDYVFEGPNGKASLSDLFEGCHRRALPMVAPPRRIRRGQILIFARSRRCRARPAKIKI